MRISLLIVLCFGFIRCFSFNKLSGNEHGVVIRGNVKGFDVSAFGDTMILEVWDTHMGDPTVDGRSQKYFLESKDFHPRVFKAAIKNGTFRFSVPDISKATYCSMGLGRKSNGLLNEIFKYYIIESGDEIQIFIDSLKCGVNGVVDANGIKFSGRGSAKFRYKREAHARIMDFSKKHPTYVVDLRGVTTVKPDDSSYWFTLVKDIYDHKDEEILEPLAELKKLRQVLTPISYNVLFLDLMTSYQKVKDITYSVVCEFLGSAKCNYDKSKVKGMLDSFYQQRKMSLTGISEQAKTLSISYANYVVDSMALLFYTKNPQVRYAYLKNGYPKYLRDKIITEYFYRKVVIGLSTDDIFNLSDALTYISEFKFGSYLARLKSKSLLGKRFYEFSLPDVNDRYHRLIDFRGKTIFMDFWYKNCAACELFSRDVLRPLETELVNDTSIVFITVSVDFKGDITKNQNSGFASTLASGLYTNPTAKNVINLYTDNKGKDHPIIIDNMIYAYPYPIVIDKNGIVQRIGDVPSSRREIKTILERVKSVPLSN